MMTIIDSPSVSSSVQFSSLPSELRSQIWRDVLPEELQPTVLPYKKGCWQPRIISESDEDYDPVDFSGVFLMFRHELLGPVEVDLPLFFVDREARGIARDWLSQQGIEIRFHRGAFRPTFVRGFDPSRDILYIPQPDWHEFCAEPYNRPFEPDWPDQSYFSGGRQFSSIAISEELFMSIGSAFGEDLLDYYNPAILFVITNPRTNVCPHDDDRKQQWILGGIHGQALIWDFDHRRFNWDKGEHICDQDLYKRMEEMANRDISEHLVKDSIRSFEIRPVLAIKV